MTNEKENKKTNVEKLYESGNKEEEKTPISTEETVETTKEEGFETNKVEKVEELEEKSQPKNIELDEPVILEKEEIGTEKGKEKIEKAVIEQESKNKSIEDKAKENFDLAKENEEMWVTLSDPAKNYWNSADEAYFYITQGRCKKLPDKLTPIIQNAVGDDNPMLREATDEELLEELIFQEKEHLVSSGQLDVSALEIKKEDSKSL